MKKELFPSKVIVYTDGGSRGNPGPSALGVVIAVPERRASPMFGRGEKEYGEYLGEMTNNQAEYRAVIFALQKLKQLIGKKKAKETEVEIRMDSELVVKQLTARYKILEQELQPLFIAVWNLRFDFKNVTLTHIPRTENRKADALVNKALNDKEKNA